jgi:MFS family permease
MANVDPRSHAANKAALEGFSPEKLPFLVDFWLFFTAMMLGIGAGVTVVNNLSQMVSAYPSLAPDAAATSRSLMKLLACTNTLGRLASGSLSDKLAHKVGRVQFTVYLLALMALGQFALAIGLGGTTAPMFGLVVGVVVVGWAFGALFWATPLLVMELFGPKNFGANRGLVGLSPAIGGYVMSTVIAGRVYAGSAGVDNNCDAGAACYRATWWFNTFAVVGATGMMWWLARRRARGRGMGPVS